MPKSAPRFEWRVYADATCAGLAALIPLPGLDLAVEAVFRRRMPGAICRARLLDVDPETRRALGRMRPWLTLKGCLLAPLSLPLYILKRLSRKILYFLTVHEAVGAVSYYWQRAFLINHLARTGQLQPLSASALPALDQTLADADSSALRQVARQVVQGSRNVWLTLSRARRRGAAEVLHAPAALIEGQWEAIQAQLSELPPAYQSKLAAVVAAEESAPCSKRSA